MSETRPDRRTQFVSATLRLVAQEGMAAVTTRSVAREAELNLGTLHYLFGSKDALLAAVLESVTDAVVATLSPSARTGRTEPRSLDEICGVLASLVRDQPRLALARHELLLSVERRPGYAAVAAALRQRYLDALAALHDEVAAGGPVAFAREEFVQLVATLIDGLAIRHNPRAANVSASPSDRDDAHLVFALLRRLCQSPSTAGALIQVR